VNKNFVVSRKKLYNLLLRGWLKTSGRASRQEYIARLFLVVVYVILWFLFNPSTIGLINLLSSFFIYTPIFIFQMIISCFHIDSLLSSYFMSPILFLPIIQLFFATHRRLHDLNSSGWWQIVAFIIPFGQLMMIGLIFFKGTNGPNRFGNKSESNQNSMALQTKHS
jgi:uncharacterized membrane protein YhaH (DUF805 family)